MQVGFLNALDILLLFILFLGLLIGLIRGAMTQIISLASIWLGLLGALWLYKLLSIHILQGIGLNPTSADTLAFLILLIVMFNAIRLVVKSLTTTPETPEVKTKKKNPLDPLDETSPSFTQRFIFGPLSAAGGIVFGLILTALWVAIILGVMQFSFQVDISNVPGVEVSGRGIANQLRGSTLAPYFNRVLWFLVQSVDLFVLDARADILKRVVDTVTEPAKESMLFNLIQLRLRM